MPVEPALAVDYTHDLKLVDCVSGEAGCSIESVFGRMLGCTEPLVGSDACDAKVQSKLTVLELVGNFGDRVSAAAAASFSQTTMKSTSINHGTRHGLALGSTAALTKRVCPPGTKVCSPLGGMSTAKQSACSIGGFSCSCVTLESAANAINIANAAIMRAKMEVTAYGDPWVPAVGRPHGFGSQVVTTSPITKCWDVCHQMHSASQPAPLSLIIRSVKCKLLNLAL